MSVTRSQSATTVMEGPETRGRARARVGGGAAWAPGVRRSSSLRSCRGGEGSSDGSLEFRQPVVVRRADSAQRRHAPYPTRASSNDNDGTGDGSGWEAGHDLLAGWDEQRRRRQQQRAQQERAFPRVVGGSRSAGMSLEEEVTSTAGQPSDGSGERSSERGV